MSSSLSEKIKKINKISIWKFIKYNYLTKGVKRKKGAYIIPFKNAILEMQKNAELIVEGNLHFGINKLKGSKAETYVRIAENAKWIMHEDVLLFFDTFVDVHKDAVFESGFFSANSGSVIVAGKSIKFGHDVMIGRNVTIYDSDFHEVLNEEGQPINFSKDVVIQDRVWLTNNITVLKGVTIGEGALISAMSMVRKDVPPYALVAGIPAKVISEKVIWSREYIHEYEKQFWEKEEQ